MDLDKNTAEGVAARFRRYREQADATLKNVSRAEKAAREFAGRFFGGLEACDRYAKEAGFEAEARRSGREISLRLTAGEGASCEVVFALLSGAAHEEDGYLMHETLSRGHALPSSGYSGRVLGWVLPGGRPCQTFAVYPDGTWRTRGMLVEKSRGRLDDPDGVMLGFCLRIFGRMVDLCAPTDGAGRVWKTDDFSLDGLRAGERPPTETRWLK